MRRRYAIALVVLLAPALLALGGCAGQITEYSNARATEMFVAPTATAAAIANRANEIRVTEIAVESARLELERDRALQGLSLSQQVDQQVEEHVRQMALISSTYAYSLSLVEMERISRTAMISASLGVALIDADADRIERASQARGQEALNTGLGVGGMAAFIGAGLAIAIGMIFYARRKGRERRPDPRTGKLPVYDEGGVVVNWNKTSASALVVYRPSFWQVLAAWQAFRAGRMTADELHNFLTPVVRQIGEPQLELAAANSADQRDMFISGTWNMEGKLDGPRKSMADRLADLGKGLSHLKDRLLPAGAIPPARMLTVSKDEIRQFQSSMADEEQAGGA